MEFRLIEDDSGVKQKIWEVKGEDDEFYCHGCGKPTQEGFMCETPVPRHKIWCAKCHKKLTKWKCHTSNLARHVHYRFRRG